MPTEPRSCSLAKMPRLDRIMSAKSSRLCLETPRERYRANKSLRFAKGRAPKWQFSNRA